MKKFFKNAFARKTDLDTSKAAAHAIDTATLETLVYKAIASFGKKGCTSDDVLCHPSIDRYSYGAITPRYAVLIRKGLIEDTGERRKARFSNRAQRVMRITK